MVPLRFIAHIGLFVICIYVFCFASPLWGSSWTNWLWALATVIPMFCTHGGLIADDGDDDIEFEFKCTVCCIDSLCIASMLIKIFTQIPEVHSIILLIAIFFIMEIGLNRMASSHVFGWTSLFMVWPYANFHSWKEIVGFIVLCLVVVGLVTSSSIYQYNQEEEEDEDTLTGTSIANFVLVAIIMSICLFFINHRDPIIGQLPSIGYLYLAYCILGLIIGFTNNIAALLFSIAAGVCYLTFLSSWSVSLDWSIHGMTSIWEWVSSFFITLWHWVAWGAIHLWDGVVWLVSNLWDGIVWCVVGLWKCIVWLVTHIWDGIVWIASAIWWLLCWKWFWVGLAIIVIVALVVTLVIKDTSIRYKYIEKELPIEYNGRYMTCPKCRRSMPEGKPTDKKTRAAAKIATRTGVKVAIVGTFGASGAAIGAAKGAVIGSIFPGPGNIIGAGIGAIAGIVTTSLLNKKINKATDSVVDNVHYEFGDGVLLHFKCPRRDCGYEWERFEKYGEIVH